MASSTTAKTTRFTDLMLRVSVSLSQQDLSNIKLFICSEKLLKQDVVNGIKYGADLFRLLINNRYISDSNLQLMITMLRAVGRKDLVTTVSRYQSEVPVYGANGIPLVIAGSKKLAASSAKHKPEAHEHSEEFSCSPMTVDEDADSQPSSSQESSTSMKSLSDEEKLFLINGLPDI